MEKIVKIVFLGLFIGFCFLGNQLGMVLFENEEFSISWEIGKSNNSQESQMGKTHFRKRPGPDIKVTNISCYPDTLVVGGRFGTQFTVTFQIQNCGHTDIVTPFELWFFFARNSELPSKSLGRISLDSLKAGGVVQQSVNLVLHPNAEPGAHAIGVLADRSNRIRERNDMNNRISSVIWVIKENN
jgi:hypothetical protein